MHVNTYIHTHNMDVFICTYVHTCMLATCAFVSSNFFSPVATRSLAFTNCLCTTRPNSTHTHTHPLTSIHPHTHTSTYIPSHPHPHINSPTFTPTHIHSPTHTHLHPPTPTHTLTPTHTHTDMTVSSTTVSLWPSLVLHHLQVEVDELQVAGRRGVVAAPQLCIELLCHQTDTRVDLHTHAGDLALQTRRGGDLWIKLFDDINPLCKDEFWRISQCYSSYTHILCAVYSVIIQQIYCIVGNFSRCKERNLCDSVKLQNLHFKKICPLNGTRLILNKIANF